MTATRTRPGLSPVEEAAVRRLGAGYAGDPVAYAREFLGVDLTAQQQAVAEALHRPPYRVLVPSANTVGKTRLLGVLINHHHDTHDPGIVLATSSSFRQVRSQLFKEVRRLRPFGLGLAPKAPEIHHTPSHFVLGFSTNKADSFHGHHEGSLLLVMDEATGVPGEFADRGETMFQGVPGHGWIATYNPNDPTAWPYAAEQGGGWAVCRLSALDHPNIHAEWEHRPPPIPSAVRLSNVAARIRKECEPCGATRVEGAFEFPRGSDRWWRPIDPRFEPQVLGRWPSRHLDAIWSEGVWRRCLEPVAVEPGWPLQIGCDAHRGGADRATFAVRHGLALVHLEARSSWPTSRISFHIAERLRELAHRYAPLAGMKPREVPCLVDDTGGYGSGVVDYPEGYTFVGVNSSESASDPTQFPNKRSELWFCSRLAADQGAFRLGNLIEGHALLADLKAEMMAVRYSLDRKNRRVAEGKDQVKARIRVSPDLADGCNLAWFPVAA